MKKQIISLLGVVLAAVLLFGGYLLWARSRNDSVGPEFAVEEILPEVSVLDPDSVLLQGITAWDDRDGDVTDSILVESVYGIANGGDATVTYAAFDAAGNVSKIQRTVRFTDYTAPRFTLSRSLAFASNAGVDVLECVGATDALDGDIHRRVRATLVSDTTSLYQTGTHQVQFQVTNSLGDTVQAVLPVEVYSPDRYNAALELDQYLLYLTAGDDFTARDHLSALRIWNTPVDLSHGVPSGVSCTVDGQVDTDTPGVYPVTYTVSKTENGTTYTGYSMLIVIVT